MADLLVDLAVILAEGGIHHYLKYYLPTSHMPGHVCGSPEYNYPLRSGTLSGEFLYQVTIGVPILSFVVFELFTTSRSGQSKLVECLRQIAKYIFGMLLMLIIGQTLKSVTGVPRPYYNTVCKPKCTDGFPYVIAENEACQTTLREATRSFPALHASVAFYAMVYFVLYVEARWTSQKPVTIKPTLQGAAFVFALYASCTRITDYKHHTLDVVGGVALGILVALFVVYSCTDILKSQTAEEKPKYKRY
ncbi:phospholipid phosphatase 3-like [Anneissia japonica]|uniref:phospholipid phosphatase 3-like n=1 Tax=Anneissia japonica TaxID=1529436 RepID=UPI00142599BE|nr:phospholipid phosphatase 3-like [Anneissia japonica]